MDSSPPLQPSLPPSWHLLLFLPQQSCTRAPVLVWWLRQAGPWLGESYFSRRLLHQVFNAIQRACSFYPLWDC